MSLDLSLVEKRPVEVFECNITHNLTEMADEAGLYDVLWRPEENNIEIAGHLQQPLIQGIKLMKNNPKRFMAFNPENGWGSYDSFVPWLEKLLEACIKHPEAKVKSCT